MTPQAFTALFLAALTFVMLTKGILMLRQIRHVRRHRDRVPEAFADAITPQAHLKAADYTQARARVGLADMATGAVLVLALTLGGGLDFLHVLLGGALEPGGLAHGVALLAALGVVGWLVDLPFSIHRIFVLEKRFGFNRTTPALFLADLMRGAVLATLIGLPVLFVVLWLMESTGSSWWLWVWAFWIGFNLLAVFLWPTFIAPLFNRFTPLADEALGKRVEALLARCGFRARGLYVMDGSRRSTHGNAYFTGFGAARRIVFYDTLLEKLRPEEVEAVLAHELGHFRLHHVWKRFALGAATSLALLWMLGWLMQQAWFYAGLGVEHPGTAMALALFALVVPLFTFPFAPLMSHWSRVHEFEADRYAAEQSNAADLVSALVKLYRDNAATLTPDPVYSRFFDSHPPASIRVARLRGATA